MKYINAKDALPKELLKELQKYIQGETLYVPKTKFQKWGTYTGIKDELSERNKKIKSDYFLGESVEILSNKYHLSPETIKKIIYSKV